MTTMAQAIREFVEKREAPVSSDEIKSAVTSSYPDKWTQGTLQAHLYGCAVNNPKAYLHHANTPKFLYKNPDGTFELYSEEKHGPNEWAPQEGEDESTSAGELIEASIGLERDIEDHLVNNLALIEPGLVFEYRQYNTAIGRIDILARDKYKNRVVVELKVGDAKDSSVGQIARYLGWFTKLDGKAPRGILIASAFPDGVKFAASIVPNLRLLAYHVHFSFDEAKL
jgi:endonuclease